MTVETFAKDVPCPICQGVGAAVYLRVGKKSTRLQSFDCPGGCWQEGSPGAQVIKMLNAAPVVER